MNRLKAIVRRIYDSIRELDEDEFVDNGRRLLEGYSRSEVLAAVFLEFQSSLSRSLLLNLGFWFETIEYEDILEAMLQVGMTDLPAYHFAVYVPEIFGVDVKRAAEEIREKYPERKSSIAYFTRLSQSIGPSRHALEKLEEFGASPEKIRENLRNSGAPLLPLPDVS